MGKIKKKGKPSIQCLHVQSSGSLRPGSAGQAKNFITRTQAVRKLQISLPDFRRLCIFKGIFKSSECPRRLADKDSCPGIYPREPRNKKKASKSSTSSTTFYYTKDIQYLLHEPLLRKFREHKTLSKKISRALGRGEVSDAARLEKNLTPRLSLDHVIKERYPTFIDALRDLDDALSMLFLFANLPSTTTVPPKTIALCQRLCLEFQHYLITTHSLRKSFLSIKGIYYQATIQGQDILWLVPYKFVQRVTGDVDFRIMGTFVEFYTTLLGFVNFRLYTSIGLTYPPKFNAASDDRGGELRALTLEGKTVSKKVISALPGLVDGTNGAMESRPEDEYVDGATKAMSNTEIESVVRQIAATEQEADVSANDDHEPEVGGDPAVAAIDTFDAPISADADMLLQPSLSADTLGSLFAPLTFFLSRETPRQPLEFLLRAFGCKRIAWDAVLGDGSFISDENDPFITHQVVDRPPMPMDSMANESDGARVSLSIRPRTRIPGRTYIQPQWVWDSVNEGRLLRPDLYAPGAELPPHLSPWVKPSKGQYDPTASLAEQEREGEAEEAGEDSGEASELEEQDNEDGDDVGGEGDHPNGLENDVDEGGMHIAGSSSDEVEVEHEDEWDGLGGDAAAESDDELAAHQRELEAEVAGVPLPNVSKSTKDKIKKATAKKRREEQEELERQKMMMSRKKRKMLEKMLHSNRKKDDEAEALRAKRRKIEKSRAA